LSFGTCFEILHDQVKVHKVVININAI